VARLTDHQVIVLAAVERLGTCSLADLYRAVPQTNVLTLADELHDLHRAGLVEREWPESVDDLLRLRDTEDHRWRAAPIRRRSPRRA
jgi:hypothetical protein